MSKENDVFSLSDKEIWQEAGEGIKRQLLGHNKQIMMAKIRFEKGAVGNLHHHPHVQASYVASGSFRVRINGKTNILKQGDGFFVPANAEHGCECLEEGLLIDVFSPMRDDFI